MRDQSARLNVAHYARSQRRFLWLLLPALLLALLLQGMAAKPASAQSGGLTCGSPVRVLAVVNNSYSAEPVLSENGNRVLFWSTANPSAATNNTDGNIEVFTADLTLTAANFNPQFRQWTQSSGSILGGFNLSPASDGAGRYLVFFSDRDLVAGQNSDANFEIFRLDTTNNQILQVTQTVRGSNLFPSISGDGRLVAFTSDIALESGGSGVAEDQRNLEVFIADLSNPTAIRFDQVTNTVLGLHNNEDPVLSGDGSTLAFVSDFDGNSEVYLYRVGSNAAPVNITNRPAGISAHPSLSYDGSRLVLLSDQALEPGKTTGGNPQVFLYPNPQTRSGFFQITQTAVHGHPVIDGVGNRVSYQRINGSQEDIFLYDVANGAERQISVSAAGRTRLNPSISRTGTVIAYEDTGEIFVVNCPIADLALTVEGPSTAIAGLSSTFRWSVTNNGTSGAAGVEVRGAFPAGFTLDTANANRSPECSQSGVDIVCSVPLVTVNETRVLTLPVKLAPDVLGAASITVETRSLNVTDPVPGNNQQTTTLQVDAEADLRLTQPVTTAVAPLVEEPITYTLALFNAGPSVARDVRITNTLPAEVVFVSAPNCTHSNGVVTCDVAGLMQPNSILTRTVVARVSALTETSIVNDAVAGSSTRDPNPANNRAIRSDRINTTFDLALTQSVDPSVLRSGAPITFTFAVTNLGPSIAAAVELSLTLPAQFTPITNGEGQPLFCATFACAPNIDTSRPFTIGLGARSYESVTVAIPGRMDAAFTGQITLAASVNSAEDPLADRNLTNNDSTATYDVFQEADLTVESITLVSEVVAGAPVTYVISALNNGPSVANSAVLTFSIQPGATITELDVNQGTCSGSSLITCEIDVLAPTERLVVTATATLDAALTGVLTTTAGVRSNTNDLTPVFDNRTRTDTVVTRAELTLRNQPSSPQVVSGQDNVQFDLVVTNLGPSLARSVVLTNVLPISTTANQIVVPGGVVCGPLARSIVCDLGNLTSAAPVTITVRAGVNADAVGTLVNSATVDSTITDPLTVDSVAVSTIQRADLRVLKSVIAGDRNANSFIDVGERITYSVVVSNAGPSNATGIVVGDQVPAILGTVLALPTQGNFSGDLWTVGSLAAGRQTTLTISALLGDAASGQTITNTAILQAADQPDPVSVNNSASVTLSVSLAADLAVAMSVSNATPQVLDQITYWITVTNNGPEDATGVTVTDALPAALAYLSHSPGAAAYVAATGIWTIGSLAEGQSESVAITARVVGSGNIVNTATVDGTLIDPESTNDVASAPIVVGLAADLRLGQSFSDETPNVDDDLVIVLTLTNDGPDTANDINISYPIPALLTGAAVTTQGSATYTTTSGLWTVPTLASGASSTLTVRRTLDRSGSFSSVAEILVSSLFDPDSAPGNGTGRGEDDETRVTVTVPPAADVEVVKSVNQGPFKEGDTVSYTLLVRNNGPDTATNVVVTETLPITLLNVLLPTISIASDDGSDSSFVYYPVAQADIVTGTLVWNAGTLTNGDTESLFLSLTVQPNTAGRTIADATDGLAANQYDWRPENNVSSAIVVVDGADLAVTKAVNDANPNVEDTLVYTLTVTNNGPTDTTNVVVVDQLPAGLAYIDSLSTSSGSYNNATGAWTIPALANQQTATLLITATINTGLTNRVITNTVTSATSSVADGDLSNNTPSVVISVQQADLRVSIQPLNTSPYEGQITTYFIVVENTGPDIATNVVLTHALPISLTNRGGAPTQGIYTLATNRWQVGTLAVGASARLSFFAEPNPGTGGQTISLTIAQLALDQEDPTPAITASGVITVLGSDLRIPQIAVSDETPAAGVQIRYTATVENLGPSPNSNVILTQTIPTGTTFVSAQDGATVAGNSVAWTLSLNVGASATRAMTVTVNAAAGTNLVASAVTASGLVTTPDNIPLNNSNSVTVTVNQPPQITLSPLAAVNEGSLLAINGFFTDTDSPSILSAQVNYGDGSAVQTFSVNQTPGVNSVTGNFALSRRYADNGVYTVAITLTDSTNNAGSIIQPVTVNNVAPTVTPRANISGGVFEGSSFPVADMVTFTDPGFSAFASTETFTYSINWGDNSPLVTGVVTDVTNGSLGVATSGSVDNAHIYADNGIYTVTVTITDDDGGSNAASFTIGVANVPPVVIASANRTVAEGALLSITDIVTFTDPAWSDVLRGSSETFTYSIDWGNGSPSGTGTATVDVNGSLGVPTLGSLNGAYTYPDDDGSPFTVTVTVTDDNGGSGQATFQVTVTNVSPTITAITANRAVTEGLPLTITNVVSFSDPGWSSLSLGASETFTYSINRGDGGAPVTGSIVNTVTNGAQGTPTVGTFDVTLTYPNDDDGIPFTTTVTIFDDNGGSVSGAFRVQVFNTNPTVALVGPAVVNENDTLVHTYNFTVTDTGIGGEVYAIIGSPSCGTGTLTGTPVINPANGIGNFQCIFPDGLSNTAVEIEVSDGTVSDITAQNVTVVNLNPVAVNDTETTNENTPVTIDVLANDSDVPADPLTISGTSTPVGGTATVVANQISYDPNGAWESLAQGQTQPVVFTYDVADGDGGSATATVTVTVTGVNDAPVLTGSVLTPALDDTASAAPLFGNVSVADPDTGETLTLEIELSNANAGTITGLDGISPGLYRLTGQTVAQVNTALGNATFTPANQTGPSGTFNTTFTVRVIDSQTASDDITSGTLTITRINDAPTVTGDLTTFALNDNAGASAIFGNMVVADLDGGETLTLEIQLSNAAAGTISGGGFSFVSSGLYRVTGLSVANANTALDNVNFTPTNNTASIGSFSTTFTVTVTDSQTASNNLTSGTLTITIQNDIPALSGAVNTTSLNDNAGATAIFGGVAVTDADAAETVSLQIQVNTASAGTISGGGFVDQTGGVYLVTGLSVAAANTALDNVTFTPADNTGASGSFDTTFTITVTDSQTASDAFTSDPLTINISNDAPTVNGTVTTTGLNDTSPAVNIFGNVSVDDPDIGESLTLEIQLSNASAGTISGGGFTDQGGGLYRVTSLSVANANTALDNATFTPTNNSGPSGSFNTTFTVTAIDSQAASDDITSGTLTITRINDAPTVTGSVTTTDLNDNAGATSIFGNVVIADVDTGDTLTLQIQLSSAAAGTISGGGFINQGSGLYEVTGLSVGAANTALDAATFTPANNTGTSGTLATTFTVVATDSQSATDDLTSGTLTINVINDLPVINNLDGDVLDYTEDDDATVIDQGTGATVTDADAPNFDTGTLTISIVSGGDSAEDVLAIRDQGNGGTQIGVSGSNVTYGGGANVIGTFTGGTGGTPLVVTLNATSNSTSVGALVRNITYVNLDTTNPTPGNRTVRFVLTDGDGGTSSDVDATVNVIRVNSAPVLGGLRAGVTIPENTANSTPTVLDPSVTFTDADNGDFNGGSLTADYSANGTTDDQLAVNNEGNGETEIGVSGSIVSYSGIPIGTISNVNNGVNGQSLVITFNDSSSVAAVDALIENLIYTYTQNALPTNNQRTVRVTVNDGSGAANATDDAEIVITVSTQNDAPVLDAGQNPTLNSILEDAGINNANNPGTTVASLIVNGSITDPDGTAVERMAVIAVDNTNGAWQYSANGSIWSDFSGSSGIVNIEANARLLSETYSVRFVPTANFNGSATFTFRAWDSSSGVIGSTTSATTNGGATAFSSATDTASITVTPVNDAPTLTTISILTGATEDTVFSIDYNTLAAAANEADIDSATISFRVEAVSTGTLTQNSNPVVAGTTTLGPGQSLEWTPANNANGTVNAFTVVAFDGAAASSTPVQVQVSVNPQNDPPVQVVNNGITVATIGVIDNLIDENVLSYTDVDNGPSELVFTLVTAPTVGSLRLNDVDLVDTNTFTQQDILNDLLTYDHTGADGEDDEFVFTVSDGTVTSANTTFNITVVAVGPLSLPLGADLLPRIYLPFLYAEDASSPSGLADDSSGAVRIFVPLLFLSDLLPE